MKSKITLKTDSGGGNINTTCGAKVAILQNLKNNPLTCLSYALNVKVLSSKCTLKVHFGRKLIFESLSYLVKY